MSSMKHLKLEAMSERDFKNFTNILDFIGENKERLNPYISDKLYMETVALVIDFYSKIGFKFTHLSTIQFLSVCLGNVLKAHETVQI